MNQYERLLNRQQKVAKWTILSIVLFILILVRSCVSLVYLIESPYSTYFVVFISFILPIIIVLAYIVYIDNKLWWMEWRWFIKIVQQWKNAIIEINNIHKDSLNKYMQDFFLMYNTQNILEKDCSFDIKSIWSKILLLFNKPIWFKTFSFLVNYFSFLEEQKYSVNGRYPAELTASRIEKPLTFETKKNMMVFCQNNKFGDENCVYCYCDNWLFLKKYLYINKFDFPPHYKYIQLINKNPWFEYREMPSL